MDGCISLCWPARPVLFWCWPGRGATKIVPIENVSWSGETYRIAIPGQATAHLHQPTGCLRPPCGGVVPYCENRNMPAVEALMHFTPSQLRPSFPQIVHDARLSSPAQETSHLHSRLLKPVRFLIPCALCASHVSCLR
jgi:hypothetical protein